MRDDFRDMGRMVRAADGRKANESHFFCQAEDGIRDRLVTGVQTCALPIWYGSIPEFFMLQNRRGPRLKFSSPPPCWHSSFDGDRKSVV